MGMLKNIPSGAGVDAAYWRIAQTNVDWTSMMAHIEILGYVSEEARRAGSRPITSISYELDLDEIVGVPLGITTIMDVGSVAYGMIALQPEFTDATPVLEDGQVSVDIPAAPPIIEDEQIVEDIPPIPEDG